MSKKSDQNLNQEEKNEIKNDVKDAINNAFKGPITSIDKILNNGPKETLNQEEVDKIVNRKNKNKDTDKKPVIITLILIILIAISGLYMYFSNNPKTIFIKTIDKTFNILEKNTIPKYEKTKGNLTLNLEENSNTEKLSNLKFAMNYELDTKNSLFNADTKLTSVQDKLLDIKIIGEHDKTYLYSENILNKFIQLDIKPSDKDDIKIILDSLNKAITKSIENEKFNGSKKQIDVNGEKIKTYKSSFILDQSNIENVLNSIGKSLNDDEKFINTVSSITNKTKEETQNEIKKKINKSKQNLANVQNLTFNIYTKGAAQKFVKLEINKTVNNETSIVSLTKIDDNKYKYVIDDKFNHKNIQGNIEYKNKKDESYIKLDIKGNISNNSNTNLTLILNNKYKKVNNIELPDTSDAVTFSESSDADKVNIITKIFFTS